MEILISLCNLVCLVIVLDVVDFEIRLFRSFSSSSRFDNLTRMLLFLVLVLLIVC